MADNPMAPNPNPAATIYDVIRSMNVVRSILNRDYYTRWRWRWANYHGSATTGPEYDAQQDRE